LTISVISFAVVGVKCIRGNGLTNIFLRLFKGQTLLGVEWVFTEFTKILSVNDVKYVLKSLAISRWSLLIFPSISIDEIPWLHLVLLVSDLIMCHAVFDLLLEVKSNLL